MRGPFTSDRDARAAARRANGRRIHDRVRHPYKFLGLQQAGHGDILINSLPVNADSATDQFPGLFLFRRCLQETRDQARGTETVRPSSSTTVRSSLLHDTSRASAPLGCTEVRIPFLQEENSVLDNKLPNNGQLVTSKPAI